MDKETVLKRQALGDMEVSTPLAWNRRSRVRYLDPAQSGIWCS
jgi:hypothetical protein